MSKLKGFSLFVMVFLCLIGTQSLWSQTNFAIKIYATDGSGWIDSVTIGKNTAATFGIDAGLGETELPPVPPGGANQAPDFRAIDPTGNGTYGGPDPVQGLGIDLRLLSNDFQRDVYLLSFRRSDPEGSVITLTWPAGLDTLGGKGWFLTDQTGINAIFNPVDMGTQTSFTHTSFNLLAGSQVFIVAGDGRKFRTFKPDSLANAADSKGKAGKAEKRKPTGSEGCFTFTNESGVTANELYVEWSQVITGHISLGVFETVTPLDPVKPAKITYGSLDPGDTVIDGGSTTICLKGNKGKDLVTKKWFFRANAANVGLKPAAAKTADPGTGRLTYNRPNPNNVGEEIYAQSGVDPVNGIVVGLTTQQGVNLGGKPIFRYVYHPKWKDVLKTLYKKGKLGILYQSGDPACLDTLNSKEVLKATKGLPPDKTIRIKGDTNPAHQGNRLLGELVALKVNIAASLTGKTQPGFGGLIFNDPADPSNPYNTLTINDIAMNADSALSCVGGLHGGYTLGMMTDLLARLNGEFSASFDTTSFGTGKTVSSGVKALALASYLTATAAAQPIQYTGTYSELYDVPKHFELSQNYPNPFNPTTTIDFTLPADAFVTLKVYNLLGQEVATLLNREDMTEGDNSVEFDASRLSTGVYYYRLVVNDGEFQQVRKMLLMK